MFSRTRGYLPHWESPRGTYFLTFRLGDSLPQDLLVLWNQELKSKIKRSKFTPEESNMLMRERHRKIEEYADRGHGECWLRNELVAAVFNDVLSAGNNKEYLLHVWTIMPNHVHILFSILGLLDIGKIVHGWKGASAFYANRLLGRTGEFWQREYFDRSIRSEKHFHYCVEYTLNNPVKAGLCQNPWEWPWTGYSDDILEKYRCNSPRTPRPGG